MHPWTSSPGCPVARSTSPFRPSARAAAPRATPSASMPARARRPPRSASRDPDRVAVGRAAAAAPARVVRAVRRRGPACVPRAQVRRGDSGSPSRSGEAVARRWRRAGAGGDVLVPVPVHAERARRRGYDQAELIAARPRPRLGLPCAPSSSAPGRRSPSSTWTVASGRRTSPARSASSPAAGARRAAPARGSLDRPRRRRRHDRRDARGVRRAAARGRRDRRLGGHRRPRALTRAAWTRRGPPHSGARPGDRRRRV